MSLLGGDFPEPREFQIKAHERLRQGAAEKHRCQMLMSPTGSGKCLGKDEPVLMADGRIRMSQDIVSGDRLLGPDGKVRNVLSVSRGREPLYRITPKKGRPYVVNASHILSLRKTPGCDRLRLADGTMVPVDADVVNVNVEVFLQSNPTTRHCLKGWRSGAVDFHVDPDDAEELLLDPYWLGCWLGDGSMNSAAISKPHCKMVDEWIASAKALGYECVVIQQRPTDCPTWKIVARRRGESDIQWNAFLSHLDFYGLRQGKYIPHSYKVASVANRLELLAGMIDSDGHLTRKGFDWISKDRVMAEDFAFVCRSVGLAAYVKECEKGIKSLGFVGTYWRVSVSGDTDIIPCRDKRAAPRGQKKRHLVHGITIEPVGTGDYFGFEIDGDHLFLLGDFTVTHNTYLGMRAINEALKKGRRAIFVADRTVLVEQTSAVADQYGLSDHGIIQANNWRTNLSRRFQIASIQTLAKRGWPEADLIVIDEAHAQYSSWVEHIQQTGAYVIGLSATPFSAGLGRLFTNLVNAATMHDLTEQGVLVPMRVFKGVRADMTGAETAGGEWTDKAVEERGLEIVGDIVTEWSKHGEGRKSICFGSTIKHCEEICRQFNEAGISAAVFTSETTADEREILLREYRKNESNLRVLCSVAALSKGFDVPDVGCVILARPLRKSLSEVIQMIGRGLRSSVDTGKSDCIVLDHAGNMTRFAEDFEDIYFNGLDKLDDGEKLDKSIRKDDEDKEKPSCPKCGHSPFFKRCMACGHERQSIALVDQVPGELQEVMIGKKKVAEDRRHLWQQVCAYARQYSTPEKQRNRALALFKNMTGVFPPWSWDFASTPDAPITANTASWIRSQNIRHAKAREKAEA